MYKRELANYLKRVSSKYPVVTIVGPRQSGKSTLSRHLYKTHTYVSLEDPDIRDIALNDPRGFFKNRGKKLILDEIQRAPDLLSYIQTMVDEPGNDYHFVLTGSHQLMLMEKVTQSLAGRTIIAKLMPFSRRELWSHHSKMSIDEYILTGGYPRIYDKKLNPEEWLQQYYQTYVERDVRALINVGQVDQFERFVHLAAGRIGQLLNLSSLGNDCGISQPTAKAWLSVLKASFICFTIQPHFNNFNKRIIKTPKLYFYDTGMLCSLLRIRDTDMLATHPLRGNIFENWVISEQMKYYFNSGEQPPLYFWQDAKGHEVDIVIDKGDYLYPIEVKSSYTFHPKFIKNSKYLFNLQHQQRTPPLGECIYAGDSEMSFQDFSVRSWKSV